MLSKTALRARWLCLTLILSGCGTIFPWQRTPADKDVSLTFTLGNNLLFLTSATLNGVHGRYFFGSATPRTVLSPATLSGLGDPRRFVFGFGQRRNARISPVVLDLGRTGDAMIGSDVIGRAAVSIDYHGGLITLQPNGIQPAYMTLYRFSEEPMITVEVDGRPVQAIVDTACPDTLVLPGERETRGRATLEVAGWNFGPTDVAYARVRDARIGNRLLSRFLLSIDYRHRMVGLWRDPRVR